MIVKELIKEIKKLRFCILFSNGIICTEETIQQLEDKMERLYK